MTSFNYSDIFISEETASEIVLGVYGITGTAKALPGEIDFNFRVSSQNVTFLLKVSRPNADLDFINFQQQILLHISESSNDLVSPTAFLNLKGKTLSEYLDEKGRTRSVRLLSWMEGRIWSSVNPINDRLLLGLGERAGILTKCLSDFDHPQAHREYEWDISQASWVSKHINLFQGEKRELIERLMEKFDTALPEVKLFRQGVVHSDVNDNNIVVDNNLEDPSVYAIIDFGDAICTAIINDLATVIAYAAMGKPDPLAAAIEVVSGYHKSFPLLNEEIRMLHLLVCMKLVISVTKSAQNRIEEPDNEYLLISEESAWKMLQIWTKVDSTLAYYSFRLACDFEACPQQQQFVNAVSEQAFSIQSLFPSLNISKAVSVDMSIGSTSLGARYEYEDFYLGKFRMTQTLAANPEAIVGGGYREIRPFYSTEAFEREGNNGPEYRTAHLGIDFWVESGTPIYAFSDCEVHGIVNNMGDKNYGPTLILKHKIENLVFYTLYWHLSTETLSLVQQGQKLIEGEQVGTIGHEGENGGWLPHLHFQVILDLLEYENDFPGVAFPSELNVWGSICPDPNLLFKLSALNQEEIGSEDALDFRSEHLGKGLSLSYNKPLKMLRGDGAFLIDKTGRRYLDTVNNVAHVGHEHPRVVKAGQQQMAVLNTNSRYLHDNINEFAKELLLTFPKELSVVHFVNSGSEANELALRMAKAVTGQKDIIAVEVGYHGNTNANIDISSYKFDGKGGTGEPEFTHIVPLPDSYRGKYQGNDVGTKYASHIKKHVEQVQKTGRSIAAFICESIISCGGQIELPDGYLKSAYEYVREAGAVCIADEVQVGCGRVGRTFWGFQLHDVVPDIVTIGKPIGNGHPLAAVVCTKAVADAFANGMEYFNTFGGNPVSCAIGAEVLKVIKDENLQENARVTGSYLKEGLKNLQTKYPIIGDVRGQGLFLGFELNKVDKSPLPEQAEYLVNRMKDLGILMSTDGLDHNVIKIKPPMVFSKENADELLNRLKSVFAEDFLQT